MAKKKKEEPAKDPMTAFTSAITTSAKTAKIEPAFSKKREIPAYVGLSTGSLAFNLLIGSCIPAQGIVTISGKESTGKSTLVQEIAGSAQRIENIPILIFDPECSFEQGYAKTLGFDFKHKINGEQGVWLFQPETGEGTYKMMKDFMKSFIATNGKYKPGQPVPYLIILDSIAAMISETHLDDEGGMAVDARMHSRFLKQIRMLNTMAGGVLVMVNQCRTKVGVMYGDPTTEPGGAAPRYASDIRLRLYTKKAVATGMNEIDAPRLPWRAKALKNKRASTAGEDIEIQMILGNGVDPGHDSFVFGTEIGIIEKVGTRYSLQGHEKPMYKKDLYAIIGSSEWRDPYFEALADPKKRRPIMSAFYDNRGLNADSDELGGARAKVLRGPVRKKVDPSKAAAAAAKAAQEQSDAGDVDLDLEDGDLDLSDGISA